jgi:signal transduction histidine kinase
MMTMTTPGQWAGGLQAWGGAGSSAGYRATGRAAGSGRVFKVPSSELGRLVATWFPFGHHMISGIFQTVRNIEATARQRESLVALGRIAAGLAHELNNPAAAAVRSVDELRSVCDALLGSLGSLARHGITAEQYTALDALRREVAPAEGPRDPLAMADLEEAVGDWLDRHGVTDGWQIAPTLASVGIDVGWCDRVEALVGPEPIGAAVRWAAATVSAASLLDEVEEATSRISNLVGAVKSYSQMDRTAKEPVDVREGIQSTLVMLAHRLRGSVEVITDFADDLPLIDGYAGELNQVWTNLIDNAVDAMDGHGTLEISARRDGTDIVVDVADTGPGIPAEVMERVFEPFFTTKDVGRGTGLGLDISRRIIVTRHGGDISFDSKPGETIAHVRLPVSH